MKHMSGFGCVRAYVAFQSRQRSGQVGSWYSVGQAIGIEMKSPKRASRREAGLVMESPGRRHCQTPPISVLYYFKIIRLLIDLKWFYRTCKLYGLGNGLIFISHPNCRASYPGSLIVEVECYTIRIDKLIGVFCLR